MDLFQAGAAGIELGARVTELPMCGIGFQLQLLAARFRFLQLAATALQPLFQSRNSLMFFIK
jgi:hypothetical protein